MKTEVKKKSKTGYTRRLIGLYPQEFNYAMKEAKRQRISFSKFIRNLINSK